MRRVSNTRCCFYLSNLDDYGTENTIKIRVHPSKRSTQGNTPITIILFEERTQIRSMNTRPYKYPVDFLHYQFLKPINYGRGLYLLYPYCSITSTFCNGLRGISKLINIHYFLLNHLVKNFLQC